MKPLIAYQGLYGFVRKLVERATGFRYLRREPCMRAQEYVSATGGCATWECGGWKTAKWKAAGKFRRGDERCSPWNFCASS